MRDFLKAIGVLLLLTVIIFGFRVGRELYYIQRYPLLYKDSIETSAKTYDLDPYMVASVIWVESKFNANAVSGKGAIGLMQIMPDTGEWIAGKLGDADFSADDLETPEVSIRYGCWYLNYLDERFSGDTTLMLAAYNGGPGRVEEWLADEQFNENGQLVNIPFGETDDFIKRVENTYEIYQEFYTFNDQN